MLMLILWTIAGFIIGWITIEVIACVTKTNWPWLLNTAFSLVTALMAYTYFSDKF